MATYTNEATTQPSKSTPPKTQALEALTMFELALCECIHSAAPEDLSDVARLAERFEQLRLCLEQMRGGVQHLQTVVEHQWPEQ